MLLWAGEGEGEGGRDIRGLGRGLEGGEVGVGAGLGRGNEWDLRMRIRMMPARWVKWVWGCGILGFDLKMEGGMRRDVEMEMEMCGFVDVDVDGTGFDGSGCWCFWCFWYGTRWVECVVSEIGPSCIYSL